jgi:mannan endo-1,4-beta-mannosidase
MALSSVQVPRVLWLSLSVAALGCSSNGAAMNPARVDQAGSLAAGMTHAGSGAGTVAPPVAPSGGSSGQAGRATAGAGGGAGRAGRGGTAGRGGAGGNSGAAGGGQSNSGPHDTYYVDGGSLFDRCGEKVILRGINHPAEYIDRDGQAIPEIAKTNANAVRIFWSTAVAIGMAENIVTKVVANGMVPILEMHDSTCMWQLDPILKYWTSSDAIAFIQKHAANLIVNIANEPSPPSDDDFKSKYSSVVMSMRSAGIHVPLMIDGGNCGRDYNVLLSQGAAVLAADPDHNLLFSAHLYDPLSADQIGKVYDDFAAKKLPMLVGEFANKEPPGCGAALDYKSIISEANMRDVGWLAWSWGDNDPSTDWNSDCGEFDMTSTFSYDTLHDWGKEVAETLPDSLMNTAVRPYSLTAGKCK